VTFSHKQELVPIPKTRKPRRSKLCH